MMAGWKSIQRVPHNAPIAQRDYSSHHRRFHHHRIVARQQDCSPLPCQRFEDFEKLLRERRVEVGSRLVRNHHFRVVDERAGDGDALLLTAGQPFYPGCAAVSEPQRVQQGFGAVM